MLNSEVVKCCVWDGGGSVAVVVGGVGKCWVLLVSAGGVRVDVEPVLHCPPKMRNSNQ